MQNSNEASSFGPHGGPLVAIEDGFVELSVYERDIPPEFRLFFFDKTMKPTGIPSGVEVTIETIRPDGKRQIFHFAARSTFLQGNTDIPEPHEFDVNVNVSRNGSTHSYRSKFTEEGHSHGPGGHSHGNGIFGWLGAKFAHSHSVTEKIDASMESNEVGIRALKASLIGLLITAVFQVIIVMISGSVGLLADTIHNFADAATSIPLWIAFALARRGASRRFTYGLGKTEDVAGVVIVGIIFFSACVALWESVRKILHPEPIGNLWWVAAAACVGFIGNEAVAVFRIRVGRQIGSAALIADGQHARVDGFTSLAVLLGVIGVWAGYPIIDPIVGILITFAILFIVKDAAKSVGFRLIDGIEPGILAELEHAPLHVEGVQAVKSVRARWNGHKIYTDVQVAVEPSLSVREADLIAERVEASMREHEQRLGQVVVRISPASA
jgi:cation diffusion facilitator family transporter